MSLHAIRLYEKLRLYQPLGLLFEPDAQMPPNATVGLPLCLLCQSRSELPPAKVGWAKPDGEPKLFMVCQDCGFDLSDAELEKKIVERIIAPVEEPAAA
jgi:hypothetical protein